MLKLTNDLENYLKLVNKYFYMEEVPPFKKYPDEYYKEGYVALTAKKNTSLEKWWDLMEEFQKNPAIKSVRDMCLPDPHSYKAVLEIRMGKNCNNLVGITVFLSFLGNYIGYYFSDSDGLVSDLKTINPSFKPIQSINSTVRECSYHPIHPEQERLLPEIIGLVKKEFPGFTVFNNEFADYKVPGIQMDDVFFRKDIDLFQVFFGTNIHGVL